MLIYEYIFFAIAMKLTLLTSAYFSTLTGLAFECGGYHFRVDMTGKFLRGDGDRLNHILGYVVAFVVVAGVVAWVFSLLFKFLELI